MIKLGMLAEYRQRVFHFGFIETKITNVKNNKITGERNEDLDFRSLFSSLNWKIRFERM